MICSAFYLVLAEVQCYVKVNESLDQLTVVFDAVGHIIVNISVPVVTMAKS